MIGIDPDEPAPPIDPGADPILTEAAILNPGAFVRLECLGALHLIYTAAAAPGDGGWAHSLWTRAQYYRELFSQERRHLAARLDLDGDGAADATRPLNVVQFVRN